MGYNIGAGRRDRARALLHRLLLAEAVVGLAATVLFESCQMCIRDRGDTYLRDVLYAFRPANIRANKMIYICFLGMMFSGTSPNI